jgi:Uma2 family endonuclease
MPFTIDESFLPATLTAHPMTDEQFAEFCAEHPDLSFEMTADGELIVTAPTFSLTGNRCIKVGYQLEAWAESNDRGLAFGSSAGFVLPDGARRSPDASWVLREKFEQLTEEAQEGFWHLCPDFVIELRSKSDRIKTLRNKMREYMSNGAQLGWLINPETRVVEVYRSAREPEILTGISSVKGEGPVAGFILDLTRIWDPLASKRT